MLPSHRISDAIEDGLSGLRWLMRRGYDPEHFGGRRRLGGRISGFHDDPGRPGGWSGETCWHCGGFTLHRCRPDGEDAAPQRRPVCDVPRGALPAFTRYLRRAQVVSPVDADLSALPLVTIHASSDELLLPDAEVMAQRLQAAGVPCDLHLWDGQIHDFPLAADVLPEGRRAIRYIGDFVKEVTENAEPEPNPGPEPGTAAA